MQEEAITCSVDVHLKHRCTLFICICRHVILKLLKGYDTNNL
jgi:hypothetical protein